MPIYDLKRLITSSQWKAVRKAGCRSTTHCQACLKAETCRLPCRVQLHCVQYTPGSAAYNV